MKTRAERRHHHQRMINRVKDFFWLKSKHYHGSEEERQKHIKQMAENRHPCSCHMCCNPRHSGLHSGEEKLTMQERKAQQKIEDDDVQL